MNRKWLFLVFLLISGDAVQADFFNSGASAELGPGWQFVPGGMATDGCLMAPLNVTGGCKGPGTLNLQRIYLDGVELTQAGGGTPPPTGSAPITTVKGILTPNQIVQASAADVNGRSCLTVLNQGVNDVASPVGDLWFTLDGTDPVVGVDHQLTPGSSWPFVPGGIPAGAIKVTSQSNASYLIDECRL